MSIHGMKERLNSSKTELLKQETETVSESSVKNNNSDGEDVPFDELIVVEGFMQGVKVIVLKDDGCNTNIISNEFFQKNIDLLKWKVCDIEVKHSNKESNEVATRIVLGATLHIGDHIYKSNWLVANCRYDVLLGMPWHVETKPKIDYEKKNFTVENSGIHKKRTGTATCCEIENISIKKFRKLIGQKYQAAQIFHVSQRKPEKEEQLSKDQILNCTDKNLRNILHKYLEVFQEELPPGLPPPREVDHEIVTDPEAKAPHRPLYQLSPKELASTKSYVQDLLQKGKIRPRRSPYGAPLFFVKEGNKPLRGVVDYRGLNRITKRNNAPLPRSDEMFDMLGDARVFSKMDLKTGFHQIRIKPEHIEKTAFNTKYGQFEYLVMPMGLCNAPATFQSLMSRIFYDCIDVFMVVYMDDLLIFSKDRSTHFKHIETVLSRLKENKLYISPQKCDFMKDEISFLGMIVGNGGIKVDGTKIQVLREWPKPKSLTEVRSFMGLLQFFRRFIKDFSKISAPLTNLTKKGEGIKKWSEQCDESFALLKEAITKAPILIAPDWKKAFRCHIDASTEAVGGTLTQLDVDGKDRVIAFFSKKLSKAEQNYSANDRELLGLIYFLERFRCYLEGSEFEVISDNQVLKSFFTKPKLSRKEACRLETLENLEYFRLS